MNSLHFAFQTVFADKKYQMLALITLLVALLVYFLTLPAMFTGGIIGMLSFSHLNGELVIFSVIMSIQLALIIPFSIWLLASGLKIKGGAVSGGLLVGLLAPMLCCSPIIPVLVSLLAIAFPFLPGIHAGLIQGFIATHETWFLAMAITLLFIALFQNVRRISQGHQCRLS